MLTKALKTRLQKLIDAINDKNFYEFYNETLERIKIREMQITKQFKMGDEVEWEDKTGTILRLLPTTCRIRENNEEGTPWTISGCMLTKIEVIK